MPLYMDFKKYFNSDNKSGCKTTSKWLEKHNNELFNKIINNTPELDFKERVFLFINNLKSIPVCKVCDESVKFKGDLNKGYSKYCSMLCTNRCNDRKELTKSNLLKKFGVESINQIDSVKESKKLSLLKNYGVDNPMKVKEFAIKNIRNYPNPDNKKLYHKEAQDKLPITYKLLEQSKKNKIIVHENCNNVFNISTSLFSYRLASKQPICTICNKLNSYSYSHNELFEFIKEIYDDEIINNCRGVIGSKELDIYLPNLKLAFEYNGMYWHSDTHKSKQYHFNKYILCKNQNIELIQIFEDQWINKKQIIKNIITNKINKTYTYRNFIIKKIENNIFEEFNFINSIKIIETYSNCYGLFDGNLLFSVFSNTFCYSNSILVNNISFFGGVVIDNYEKLISDFFGNTYFIKLDNNFFEFTPKSNEIEIVDAQIYQSNFIKNKNLIIYNSGYTIFEVP